ncbi:MAG: hypothetical protein IT265_02680 [Saprospiraceae bacterium]|nr:hypothetical protein [Saprospiraceae bacterium]
MQKDWLDNIREYESNKKSTVSPRVWEAVKPHIPKKKDQNRWPFIFLFGGIGLVGALALAFYVYTPKSLELSESNKTVTFNQSEATNNNSESKVSEPNNVSAPASQIHNEPTSLNTENASTQSVHRNRNRNINTTNHTKANVSASDQSVSSSTLQAPAEPILNEGITEIQTADLTMDDLNRSQAIYELLAPKNLPPLNHEPSEVKKPDPKVNCYQFLKKKHCSLYLEPYVGPGLNMYQLTAKSSENNAYADARSKSETAQLSGLAGLRLALQYQALVLKLGIQYQLINEKFTYTKNGEVRVTEIYEYPGGPLLRTDTMVGLRIIEHHNFRHLLNLPISLGYIKHGKLLDIGASVGTGLNVFAQHSGQYLNDTLAPVKYNNIVSNTNQGFKQSLGGFVTLDINVSKKIFKRSELFIEPGLIYYFNSFTIDSDPLKQKYFSPHIKFGLKVPLLF